jgi:RimJ/RimL family protein N-acetyltransferase
MPSTLHTRRLTLRPYAPTDEDAFVALFTDESVARWMGMPGGDIRSLFHRLFSDEHKVDWDVWAVCESGECVGHAELKPVRRSDLHGHELVYALHPTAWGRGLGTEVAEAVTSYGLQSLNLVEVHATVDPHNIRSLALLHKLGYVEVRDLVDKEDGEVSRLLTRRNT